MKLRFLAGVGLSALLLQTGALAADSSSLTTDQDRISYTIGYDLGNNFKNQGISVDSAIIAQGIQDGIAGSTPKLTKEQMKQTLDSFRKQLVAKRETQLKTTAASNLKAGQEFLAANKSKPGVVTLPSGLQYKILTAGTGAKPTKADSVTVDYKGSLINGTVFDSSYKRGKPVKFAVTEVIPGWTEALTHMKTGATWELYVPANLAYGEHGIGPIGPNQTLIFKVHLISIDKNKSDSAKAAG